MYLDAFTYEELISHFFEKYKFEFGNRRFKKINSKIQSSKKFGRLIDDSKKLGKYPTHEHYLYRIHEIPYFIFSKPDTVALGALMALERWHHECNINFLYANEPILKDIAVKIIQTSEKMRIRL